MTRLFSRYREWVEADARGWGVSPRVAWAAYLVPLLAIPVLAALYFISFDLFDFLLVEDGLIENAQVVVLVGVVIFAAALAVRLGRQGRRSAAVIYAVLAVGALFVAIEEISWGQRILGLTTPEALDVINRQGELNVHNIPVIEQVFRLGQLVGTFYALVVPLIVVAGAIPRLTRRLDAALVPPLFLAGALIVPFIYRIARYTVLESGTYVTNRFAEYAELTMYGAVLATIWLGYRRWAESRATMGRVIVKPQGG